MILSHLILVASMSAAPFQGPDPARMLLLSASACELAESMTSIATDAADLTKSDQDRQKALADLEEQGPAAMKSGGDSGELQVAIKDFYGASDSYCKNPSNAGKNDLGAKEKILDKLLEAVGR